MNQKAAQENSRTLAAAIGLDQEEAAALLNITIAITASDDPSSSQLARFLGGLLSRTVTNVQIMSDAATPCVLEVVIGSANPVTSGTPLWVDITGQEITISDHQVGSRSAAHIHSALLLLGACYAAARIMKAVIGDLLPFPYADPLILNIDQLIGSNFACNDVFDIETTYLAGAGAVGNGFLLALSLFNVKGKLHITDPDAVDDGNLNRCIWFNDSDIGFNKAERIVQLAQTSFPQLELVPHGCELKQASATNGGPWLKRLVIGVDSRRARRNLQTEIPGEVYDASTTNIQEIVLHFNRQPLNGLACLSCIYYQDNGELAHERHVADALGVSLEDVKTLHVSVDAARKICLRYPNLQLHHIQGLAYDSLFKQLCGAGALRTAEDQQVLAPFSFISVLAGTYLAIEFLRRIQLRDPVADFNYWRVSPWHEPILRLRKVRSNNHHCEFCGNPILNQVANDIWLAA
jgi:hypothetical protein